MRTKDGYLIHVGMWLHDADGVYEVKDIRPSSILIREVIFDSDDSDGYWYDDEYSLLPQEIRRLHYT